MTILKKGIYIFFAALMLSGCKKKNQKTILADETIIVRYGDYFLTDRDIMLILPKDYTPNDSMELVKSYIENWVKKKAIVDKAEENIDALILKEIDNKMIEYRQDLLINAYNNFLIEAKMQDSIAESEISAYFEENKESFPLSKSVIRYRSVTVNKSDEDKAEKLFNSGNDTDFDELMKIVLISGLPYHDNDSAWYASDILLSQYPLLNEDNNFSKLTNRRKIKIESDSTVTLIRILNLMPKGSLAPYEFVKPTIKNLLLNKRKLNLLDDLQNQLYKEALNNNEIKINEK